MIRQTTNNGANLNWCEIIKSILFVCISSLEMILWFSTFITLNDNLNGAVDNLQLFIILTSFLPYLLNLLQTLYQCTVGQSPKGMVVFLELAIVRVAGC